METLVNLTQTTLMMMTMVFQVCKLMFPIENLSSGLATRPDKNRAVQSQKMARCLKFRIYEVDGLYYLSSEKTKALISCIVTVQLKYAFCFINAKSRFSHDVAKMACVPDPCL